MVARALAGDVPSLDTPERDELLRSTRLIDAPPEEAFDRLSRIASNLLDAPTALVSLVQGGRQFFKSAIGLGEPWASKRETPLSHSFCKYVTRDRAPLVVADAREHDVLRHNLAVSELGVVAYAGMPLVVEDEAIGALCVVDSVPHEWSAQQLQLLADLAEVVMSEVSLRRTLRRAEQQRALTEALVDSLGDGVLAVDPQRRFLMANQAAKRVFAPGAEVGKRMPANWAARHQSLRPDSTPLPSEEGALARGLRGEPTDDLTFTLQRPDATEPSWVEVTGRPVRDADGQIIASVAVYRDVTERRRVEAKLRESEQIHRAMVRSLPNGAMLMVDRKLRYVAADGPLISALVRNASVTGLVGRSVMDVVSPDNRGAIVDMFHATLAGQRVTLELGRGDRSYEFRTVPIHEGETISHALTFCYDVTDRRRETEEVRQARDQLVHERQLFEAVLAHIEDGVALVDANRTPLVVNTACAQMFGLTRAELQRMSGPRFAAHLTPMFEHPEAALAMIAGQAPEANQEMVLARPVRRVLRRSWTPVELPTGQGFLATWHDATAEKAVHAEREHQLHVDALTGIPNRRAAQAALGVEVSRMRRTGAPLCVAVFDIDHFKRVNDEHGHATGDQVLCEVARTLAGAARVTDVVARWGGEEFLAILPADLAGAEVFCERTRAKIEQLLCPAVKQVTISAGIAQLAPDEDPGEAIARADQYLYEAKRAGRNRVISSPMY